MKKIKVSFLGVAALLLGICLSAFTSAPDTNKKNIANGWFIYDGSGPLDDPSSYSYNNDISPCNAHVKFCAFYGTQSSNPLRPTTQSLADAMEESDDFTREVDERVVFKP